MKHARKDYERIQDPASLIPEEEPVFLLRGQDKVAPGVVRFWADMALAMGASAEIVNAARRQADEMAFWQQGKNAQVPDLPAPNHIAGMLEQTGLMPEPAISPAPEAEKPKLRKIDLEGLVEGAFRFDDIHVTAYRIGKHVAEGLGFKVVEE